MIERFSLFFQNNFAFLISLIALSFTIYSFWWMNWRRGKLRVSPPRIFGAYCSQKSKLVLHIPFLFFNDGPKPIIVNNLRLIFEDETVFNPITFVSTLNSVGDTNNKAFSSQFYIKGKECCTLVCEFQRIPGNLVFMRNEHWFQLQGQLNNNVEWKLLLRFHLLFNYEELEMFGRQFTVRENLI